MLSETNHTLRVVRRRDTLSRVSLLWQRSSSLGGTRDSNTNKLDMSISHRTNKDHAVALNLSHPAICSWPVSYRRHTMTPRTGRCRRIPQGVRVRSGFMQARRVRGRLRGERRRVVRVLQTTTNQKLYNTTLRNGTYVVPSYCGRRRCDG